MNRHGSPARQRGMALIMSLIFLLLLALATAALFETTTSQSRLSVAQQLSREQFLNIQCALSMISSQSDEIQKQLSALQPGVSQPWEDTTSATNCGLPDGASIQLVLLKPGYACVVPGFSDGSCLALEIQGEVEHGTTHAESRQVQGLLFETVSVAGGGDSRAGIF